MLARGGLFYALHSSFYASTSHLFRCHVLSLALLASDLVFRPQPDLLLISENLLISFCIAIL